MKRRRDGEEEGMILVNVLMFVAIAAGLVLLLITREEVALHAGLRAREAARALAVARGGELSALVALRRDAQAGDEADYPGEDWGKVAESGAMIDGGSFDLAIADAQGRFNINNVRGAGAGALTLFQAIGREAGATDEQILRLVALVRQTGPVTDLRPLRLAGLDPDVEARLERMVTALPGRTDINLNAADPDLLRILYGNPAIAQRLADIRRQRGYLVQQDLAAENILQPAGTGFTSDTYWVRTRARIGDTSQQVATLFRRVRNETGVEVVPIERWRGSNLPPDAPEFAPPRR